MDAANRSVGPVIAADIAAYRPFIDGLRAVSILLVVLYHVGIAGITGGYVGVDAFFVISGFLIISQIVAGLGRGTFSFSEFWALRCLPYAGDRIFFVDTNHPSDAGMEQIIAVHPADFDWVLGGKPQ